MKALPARPYNRGNLKTLMSIPLALITAIYLFAASDSNAPSAVDAASAEAVAAALTQHRQGEETVDQLVVTAPRLAPAQMELQQPLIKVAVVATPPSVQRDPS